MNTYGNRIEVVSCGGFLTVTIRQPCVSPLLLAARHIYCDTAGALIETLSPLIYILVTGADAWRICTLAPIVKFVSAGRLFATDVMNNYYMFDNNVIVRAQPVNGFNADFDPYTFCAGGIYGPDFIITDHRDIPVIIKYTMRPDDIYTGRQTPLKIRYTSTGRSYVLTRVHYCCIIRQFTTDNCGEDLRAEHIWPTCQ